VSAEDKDAAVPRTVAVVLNGAAGALLGEPDAMHSLQATFAEAQFTPHFVPPDAGTLPERIAQAAAMGADAVIVGGGDGTVACAAQTLAGGEIPLGVLPFGTMNLLAKDLDMPIDDTTAAIAVLAAGHVQAIDVADVNGKTFLCASMLGLPAHLGRFREAQRGAGSPLLAWSRIGAGFLGAIRSHRRMRAVVHLDGRKLRVRASSLSITVNALDDTSGRLFGRSRLDGGTLVLYVIRHLTLSRILILAWRMLRGNWRRDPALQEYPAREVVIVARGRTMTVMNDGELMELPLPLTYTIRPGALRVLAPNRASNRAPNRAPDLAPGLTPP
jgi:diacylglycerol kinase family enzyme